MIPDNELRINNWYYKENPMNGGAKSIEQFNNWTEALDFEGYGVPIPITPEILVKCGFEKHEPNSIFKRLSYTIWEDVSCFRLIEGLGGYFSIPGYPATRINAIHQLQSLFFAIMHKELEINL